MKRTMGLFERFDPGETLIVSALAISIPRVIGAFQQVETDLNVAALGKIGIEFITGVGFSVLVTGGAVYCWKTFNLMSVAANKKSALYKTRYVPLAFAVLQMLMEVLLVWPVLTANLQSRDLAIVLEEMGVLYGWTFLAAALPIIVIAGVASSGAFRKTFTNVKAKKSERKNVKSEKSDFKRTCGACGVEFDEPRAYSGHWKETKHVNVKRQIGLGTLLETSEGTITHQDGRIFSLSTNNHQKVVDVT